MLMRRRKNRHFLQRVRARQAKVDRLHRIALTSIALGIGLMSIRLFLH
jgi:hypothetical protein